VDSLKGTTPVFALINLAIELKASKKPNPIKPSPKMIRGRFCGEDTPRYQVSSMHNERTNK
tara:strand:- start:453 stop:635 length:183 start_codon:yes stop_codon:yes gene_type:complete